MTNVDHDNLEELLRHATPRPTPPTSAVDAARAALRDEWRATIGPRQRRRRVVRYAIAATVILGAFVAFNQFRVPAPAAEQVANIDKSFGAVYLLGDGAELRSTGELAAILSGQTIVTGADAGLAVAWADGGSLRLDQNTRVEFTDARSVFLREGRVYFDSRGSELVARLDADGSPSFLLHTAQGQVRHTGTQYMARVDGDTLVVSVREGEVTVDGNYHDRNVNRGQQLTVTGSQRPVVLDIPVSGSDWEWVGATTPPVDVDGRGLYEFLEWASRELGLKLEFEGNAEAVARGAVLRGSIDSHPADALRMRLASAALSWRIEEGVVYVGDEP
jgi:ferric-dicitrate binding protein FerR (iron transport regulator)